MGEEYSEVEKLSDQLELAKACEVLEKARNTMHANRNEENIAEYKAQSQIVSDIRVAFREKYPPPVPEEGDGVATPETVAASGEVHQG